MWSEVYCAHNEQNKIGKKEEKSGREVAAWKLEAHHRMVTAVTMMEKKLCVGEV